MRKVDCVIVGGGSAGMSCAVAIARFGIKDILMIEREKELGGILNQCIHHGFGLHIYKKECTGPEFAQLLIESVKKYHIDIKLDTTVINITEGKKVTYVNEDEGVVEVQAKAIVMACGCMERSRGMISIPGDRCGNVLTAGTAQRYLNIDGYMCGKRVFILGSGDIGLIMARRMTLEGAKVLGVAEIMPYSNGLSRNIVQCLEDFNIPLYLNTTVTRIIGHPRLERIELSSVDENLRPIKDSEWSVAVDCLLLSIGLLPDTSLLNKLNVERDPQTRSVAVNEAFEMSLSGFFACGNVLQVHDLVDDVYLEAEVCGREVARYLHDGFVDEEMVHVCAGENVAHVVPQRLRKENMQDDCRFSFRVKKPMRDCILRIRSGENILREVKKRVMLPAEMEKLDLEKSMLMGAKDLVFEVKEDV
ncbi:NAD(P)/FAD-dependent oxidoreductase [uncultured Traorella sp.]|uniref:NAD(P)/FAD-dependent oxidoreductase n=1 Tax=uncultured Traorella sp. TaxID=1929048 RepID=UPI0025EE7B83|nr:NAD(P)/FAD-dependent oxidoreductase [uncultured Traorella sp.]